MVVLETGISMQFDIWSPNNRVIEVELAKANWESSLKESLIKR